MILPDIIAISSQYPFHFDICAGESASRVRQTTTEGLDESMANACRKDGVTKRGTFSYRGRGKGSGGSGGGGGDDRRNYRKPLPEDAYTNWMEDELARIIERILERADARFLSNMPPYPDGATNTLNTNKWMNWLESVLNGCLERSCSNFNDRSLVLDLRSECVKSSEWLEVMNILELVAKVVRKVRGNTAIDSDSGDDPEW